MPRQVGSNSVLEVSFVSSYQAQRILNVFHYRWQTVSPTTGDGDAIVDAAIDVLHAPIIGAVPSFRDCIAESMNLERVRYQWVSPFRWSFVSSGLNCGPGTQMGVGLPANVGATAQKVTEYPGPAGRGSTHMTGAITEFLNGDSWTTPYKTLIGAFMSRMDDVIPTTEVIAGSTLQPILLHKAAIVESVPWRDAFVHPEPRVMYRRTLRVGQ